MCTTDLQGLIYPVIPSLFRAPSRSCTPVLLSSSRLQQTYSLLQTESFQASQLSLHPATPHHSFCCHKSKHSCQKRGEILKVVKTVAYYGVALVGWRRIYAYTQNPWFINMDPSPMFPGPFSNAVRKARSLHQKCLIEHQLLHHADLQTHITVRFGGGHRSRLSTQGRGSWRNAGEDKEAREAQS